MGVTVSFSSDQEKAIWAGLQIAMAVRRDHEPDIEHGWRRVRGFNNPNAHHLVFRHPDPIVAARARQAIEIAIGATEGDCRASAPTCIRVPKP